MAKRPSDIYKLCATLAVAASKDLRPMTTKERAQFILDQADAFEREDEERYADRPVEPVEPVEIVVNGRRCQFTGEAISYGQVLDLIQKHSISDGEPNPTTGHFTVTYAKGPSENPQGTLGGQRGIQVKVQAGMVFNCCVTGNA